MSLYSENYQGKVLDYRFKRMNEFTYAFYIGDIYLGQVYNMDRNWAAVSGIITGYGPVYGFKTRMDACQYILQVWRARNVINTKSANN